MKKCLLIQIFEWLGKIPWNFIPEEDFYSHLNRKDITDSDYAHRKRVFKDFKIRNLGDYHDLYVQSDALLLSDVFKKFWNMSLMPLSAPW